VNHEERESQLSAMYDGELPAAECELLSRRLARDEQLRASWSRYALIGAAMRSEPVAAVSAGFAHRVGAAITSGSDGTRTRGSAARQLVRNVALGASLAAGVAGAAVFMLRSNLLQSDSLVAYTPTVQRMAMPQSAVALVAAAVTDDEDAAREPISYVVPPSGTSNDQALPASLANYVMAHSEYSSPLARRNLISSLMASDTAESVQAQADQRADAQQ
jgi:negative regulator of sigma E activity